MKFSMECHWISWNSIKFHGKFHENFYGKCHGIPLNFMEFHEIFHEISWEKFMKKVKCLWKISWVSMEFHENSYSRIHGISWNSVSTGWPRRSKPSNWHREWDVCDANHWCEFLTCTTNWKNKPKKLWESLRHCYDRFVSFLSFTQSWQS
jgi:hypothetical protein